MIVSSDAKKIVGGRGSKVASSVSRAVAPATLKNGARAEWRGISMFFVWLHGFWTANDKADLRVKNPRAHHDIHVQRRKMASSVMLIVLVVSLAIYFALGGVGMFIEVLFILGVLMSVGKQKKTILVAEPMIQVGLSETAIQRAVAKAVFHINLDNEKFQDEWRKIIIRKPFREVGETMTVRIGLPAPHSAVKARSAKTELAAALDLTDTQVRVVVDPEGKNAGDFDIVIYSTNPWDIPPTTAKHVLSPEAMNILDGIDFGVDIDRHPVVLELISKGMLIGGLPDMGKTTTGLTILSSCVLDPYVRLWIADAKGVDTADVVPLAYRYIGPSQEELLAALDQLESWGRKKLAALKGVGVKFTRETLLMYRQINPNHPLAVVDLVYIDEARFYTNGDSNTMSKRIADRLSRIVEMFRAVGIILIIATQQPLVITIPSELRNLLRIRLAHACTTPSMSNTILGEGAAGLGFSAASIGEETPGVGIMRVLKTFRQIRPHYTTAEQFAKCCEVAYAIRDLTGTLPEQIDAAYKETAPSILLEIQRIMTEQGWEKVPTYVLLPELQKNPEFDGISAASLAAMVSSWGVSPKPIGQWEESSNLRGYRIAEIEAAIDKHARSMS